MQLLELTETHTLSFGFGESESIFCSLYFTVILLGLMLDFFIFLICSLKDFPGLCQSSELESVVSFQRLEILS